MILVDGNLGARVRELRRAAGMTQERLADLMGVSYQAVSKWENGATLPDVTLIAPLARVFGVSTDALLGFSLSDTRAEIDEIDARAAALIETDPAEGLRILREGLEKYPDNEFLLRRTLYMLADPDETLRIGSRLISVAADPAVRYDALRFLAHAYKALGDEKSAVAAIGQIPEMLFTKLSELAHVASGRAKHDAAETQKWASFEVLLQMMAQLADFCESENDVPAAVAELERALRLLDAMGDEPRIGDYAAHRKFFLKKISVLRNPD